MSCFLDQNIEHTTGLFSIPTAVTSAMKHMGLMKSEQTRDATVRSTFGGYNRSQQNTFEFKRMCPIFLGHGMSSNVDQNSFLTRFLLRHEHRYSW